MCIYYILVSCVREGVLVDLGYGSLGLCQSVPNWANFSRPDQGEAANLSHFGTGQTIRDSMERVGTTRRGICGEHRVL